jgi:hypothetical protein
MNPDMGGRSGIMGILPPDPHLFGGCVDGCA